MLAVASLLGLPPRCPNGARPLALPRGVRPLAVEAGALTACGGGLSTKNDVSDVLYMH